MNEDKTVAIPHVKSIHEIEPPGSLLSDHQINALSLNFLTAEKPPGITPIDVLLCNYLIQRRALDHPVYDSQHTLALRFGCDDRSIARSLAHLEKVNWIARSKRQGRCDGLTVMYDNLPLANGERLHITQDAKELAGRYQLALLRLGRKRFPKKWLMMQFVSAQKLVDLCDGDLEAARGIVGHALGAAAFKKQSMQSLYHIWRRWKRISASYSSRPRKTQIAQDKTPIVNAAWTTHTEREVVR